MQNSLTVFVNLHLRLFGFDLRKHRRSQVSPHETRIRTLFVEATEMLYTRLGGKWNGSSKQIPIGAFIVTTYTLTRVWFGSITKMMGQENFRVLSLSLR